MSAALFYQLLVCAISLAVYMVGIETHRLLSIGFCIMMTGITSTIVSTYIYCWFAEHVSRKLSATGDIFYEYAWYRLPARQQQLFEMTILRARIEFNFTGFGLVVCSLKIFAKVTVFVTHLSSFQFMFVICIQLCWWVSSLFMYGLALFSGYANRLVFLSDYAWLEMNASRNRDGEQLSYYGHQ